MVQKFSVIGGFKDQENMSDDVSFNSDNDINF